jgi:hypothetical protein
VVDWASAARQLEADLAAIEAPLAGDDQAQPYVNLLRGMLSSVADAPTSSQLAALRNAVMRLRAPIGPPDLAQLAAERAAFAALK